MSQEIITTLDDSFSHQQIGLQYPYIELKAANEGPLPLLIDLLEGGDLPIVYEKDNVSYELKRVNKSPLNLQKLIKVYPFTIVATPTEKQLVTTTTDLMEAVLWMQRLSLS